MTSKKYWKTRCLLLEQLMNTRAEATVQQISRLYGLTQERIFQKIERIFGAYVKGGALTPERAEQLLSVRETEEVRKELMELYRTATGQAKRDIWARLSAPAYANRISRLQALRDSLYSQCCVIGLDEVSFVRDRLSDVLEQSYYRTVFDIQQYTGEGYAFDLLTDHKIRAALAVDWNPKHWSERIWDNNQQFADAVQDTVTVGIMAGLRYDEMRDNLLHVIGMDPTEGARYRSARLVKTECAYIANQGHLMGYQTAEIERYIFLATLDLRTSKACRELDMKRFLVSEAQAGTNLPPMHPHCRSTTMPDMTDEQLRKVPRAARDPVTDKSITVPGDMTYQQWYRKFVEGNPEAQGMELAVRNKAADREQFRRYQAVLGENAPKTLDDFQKLKYTDTEKFNDVKTLYEYRRIEPQGTMADALVNKEIRENRLIKGHVTPIVNRKAYILEDKAIKRDPAHIMKRMNERLITSDEVQSYVDNAIVCISQYKETRRVYFSEAGVTVLTKTDDYPGIEWIAKTVWGKPDFDDSTLKLLEVARKYYG